MAVELATAYVNIVPSARGIGAALDKEFGGPAALAGTKAGKGFGSNFGKTVATAGKVAAVGLAATATAAVGVTVGLYKVGEAFDDAYDTIRVGTGATGAALNGLKGDFKAVVSDVPASFGDASTAIADLNTRLGLTGAPLQGLSKQFLELSRITGTDLATNVDTMTRVFGDWGIQADQMPGSLDKIFRASQASGIGLEQLSTSVVQFGAPLRNLGFGFDQSLALLSQFNKTGVNTQTVFAGMKIGVGKLAKAGEAVPETFARVVSEITALGPGTEATAKAIELFGQRAGPDMADAIAGGKFAIDDMLAAITGGTDTIMKAGADTQDFGEKFQVLKNKVLVGLEPIAIRVFDAIGNGMSKIMEFLPSFTGGFQQLLGIIFKGDFKGGPFSEDSPIVATAFDLRDAVIDLKPKFDALANGFKRAGAAAKPIVLAVARFIKSNPKPVFAALAVVVGGVLAAALWSAASAMLALLSPVVLVVGAVALLVGGLVLAYQKVGWFRAAVQATVTWFTGTAIPAVKAFGLAVVAGFQWVVDWVKAHWSEIKATVSAVLSAVSSTVSAFVTSAQAVWSVFGDTIMSVASTAWTYIRKTVGNALAVVSGIIKTVTSLIRGDWSGAWNGIKQIFAGVWAQIRNIVSTSMSVLKTLISAGWNAVKSVISSALGGIKSLVSAGFSAVKGFITRPIEQAKSTISGILDGIKGLFRALPGGISSAMSGLASAASAPFRAVGQAIKDAWNSTIGGRGIKVPSLDLGPLGKIGGQSWTVPRLHGGGEVTGPPGSEQLRILEAGEWVLSRKQVSNFQRSMAGVSRGGRQPVGVGAGGTVFEEGAIQIDARGIEDPAVLADYTAQHISWRTTQRGRR